MSYSLVRKNQNQISLLESPMQDPKMVEAFSDSYSHSTVWLVAKRCCVQTGEAIFEIELQFSNKQLTLIFPRLRLAICTKTLLGCHPCYFCRAFHLFSSTAMKFVRMVACSMVPPAVCTPLAQRQCSHICEMVVLPCSGFSRLADRVSCQVRL